MVVGEMKNFTIQVLKGRWFMAFASPLIMSAAGATYLFGLYTGLIKSVLGYDQTTLNLLSFFKDLGANLGLLSGLINELTPPWVVLLLGALLNLFDYLMIYLDVAKKIPEPKVWLMCLYIFIEADSQAFANTGALVTLVKIFRESRGFVLGIQKGYLGLRGAIITQLYHAFYGDEDIKSLILMIGFLPSALSLVFLGTFRVMKAKRSREANEAKVFSKCFYISLVLAGYLMMIIIVQKMFEFSQKGYGGSAVPVFILLFLPLIVVVMLEYRLWKTESCKK